MFGQWQAFFQPRNLPAWIVLSACLLLLMAANVNLHKQIAAQAVQDFDNQAQGIINAINHRLKQHEQILLGAAGLFDASGTVNRSEWRDYVKRLNLTKNYPGILGVGFSRVIQPSDLSSHIAQMRAEGFPEYSVRPSGDRPLYTSIIYIEPFSGRNLAAFGYDMMSEPTRAKALRLSVDTNQTTMTGKVTLIQENKGKKQAGFLLYVPIYRRQMLLTTPAQRWAALEGYVYSPYRMNDLMHKILNIPTSLVDFTIYDGDLASEDTMMFDSAKEAAPDTAVSQNPQFTAQHTVAIYGHRWLVDLKSRPIFEKNYKLPMATPMLTLGVSTSVMLFFLISILSFRRIQAEEQTLSLERLVKEKTIDLHEALDLQTAVLDNAAHAIIATTAEGVITLFNKQSEKLLGYTAQEMIGKQTPAILHDPQEVADRAQAFSMELNMQLQPGFEVFTVKSKLQLPNTHEWIYIHKDGSRFPVSLSITALKNTDHKITGYLGLAVDITAQKAAELVIKENAEHMKTILDNVADGIITINQQGFVQSYNPAAEKIFGYPMHEVIDKNVNMLMPEPYHTMHDGYLKNYENTGTAKIIGVGREVEGQHKDGAIFPIDLAISQSSRQGKTLYIGLVRDITERKRVDKMKSEFVSTVSHELRTPLTAISGALGLIAGGALGDLPEKIKQMIELAYKNALRLTILINDLLDMEKLVDGKMHFTLEVHALTPLIEQTLETIHAYAEQYNVRFQLLPPVDDTFVRVDEIRLQQVLTNFLSNAAKFSHPGGQIEITIRLLGDKVRVGVIDHGLGISEEFRSRIFQKFSQADSSDSRQKGGTGLGLAISKELIEHMNGQVGFTSEPDHGSCFYFDLPIVKI